MFFFDLGLIIKFWFVLFLIGILFLPLTTKIFSSFFDRGYIFSKVLGVIILSYTLFILGTIRLVPFSNISVFLIILIYLVGLGFVYGVKGPSLSLKSIRKIWIVEELIFFITLLFWSYVKGFQPDINGLEKFMDFGFINSVIRTNYFPSVDMWFPPESINYYYFGHLQTAFLTITSGIESFITYNLMIAAIFAFCFAGSFSLVTSFSYDLFKKLKVSICAGVLSAFLVTLGGNLHTIYAFFTNYNVESPVPFWSLKELPLESFGVGYWYPNATRFILNTIHEFPSYSFVVSDLHGHVLDIPTVILTLGVFYVVIKKKNVSYLFIILLAFLSAVMYMTNAWDGIIYFGIAATIITLKNLKLIPSIKRASIVKFSTFKKLKPFVFNTFQRLLVLAIGFLVFSLPFNLYFKPFASEIGVLCAPDFLTQLDITKSATGEVLKGKFGPLLFEENHCQRSPLYQLLILWGFFLLTYLLFIFYLLRKGRDIIDSKPVIFTLILFIFSTILIILPEFIYAKDIYPAHYRANTMFKLGYQAYIMFSLISGFAIVFLIKKWKKIIFIPIFSLLVILVMIYPYFSIRSYFGELTPERYQGLNGISYLQFKYPDDYKAIIWIRDNIKGQPVIAEAQGDSYTDYARVSANTGLPTILGWTVHEWLWRGDYSIPQPRIEDVRSIYEGDINTTRNIINKYDVKYIFIGNLEREKYPALDLNKFNQLGNVIFRSNGTIIYEIR